MAATRADPTRSGVLLVDKPEGPTSHDVVVEARRALDERRIGHTGTLDPFASGLLALCVGSATRLVEYFHRLDKAYRATVRFGVETETHDTEGGVVSESDGWRALDRDDIATALGSLTGVVSQRPPSFSAKRVDGERAHRAARAGREVELEPVEVHVHALELVALDLPDAEIRARVGTGTYVRALARDLGRRLGCGAHLRALRRTRIGPFRVDEAIPIDALAGGPGGAPQEDRRGWWIAPAEAFVWVPSRTLSDEEARRVAHGSAVGLGGLEPPRWPAGDSTGDVEVAEGDPVALLHGDRLAAVAEVRGERLQPRKVFADAP